MRLIKVEEVDYGQAYINVNANVTLMVEMLDGVDHGWRGLEIIDHIQP